MVCLSVIYLIFITLIFSFNQTKIYSQIPPEEKLLIEKWRQRKKIPEGEVSLKTLKKFKDGDDVDSFARITLLDLDRDGKKELAIQSDCAAVGNCGLEIYSRSSRILKPLFTDDMVQVITVLPTKSKGFHDVKLRTHFSAFDSYHRIFRFDGKTYRRKKCWIESYQTIDEKGKEHIYKKPKIIYGCGQEF
jgi:hypothetical protein